jgi:hypothetical protein
MTRIGKLAATLVGEWEWDLKLTTGVLIVALLIGAIIIAVASRWRKRAAGSLSPSDQLAEYRSLYLEGAISKEEFERLRSVLGGEMRRALDIPPPAAKPNNIQPAESQAVQPPDPPAPADGVKPG